jgi:two-component system, chemotaxis family, response regulator Rcp1
LVVEDNEADVFLTSTALRDARVANHISAVSDGESALAFLRREGQHANAPRPDVVFLDLGLPRVDGYEVLAMMKADPELRSIPVVVVSGSHADLARAYDHQIAAYIVKPASHDEYFTAIRTMKEFWFHIVTYPPNHGGAAKGG